MDTLVRCKTDPNHLYSSHLRRCDLCEQGERLETVRQVPFTSPTPVAPAATPVRTDEQVRRNDLRKLYPAVFLATLGGSVYWRVGMPNSIGGLRGIYSTPGGAGVIAAVGLGLIGVAYLRAWPAPRIAATTLAVCAVAQILDLNVAAVTFSTLALLAFVSRAMVEPWVEGMALGSKGAVGAGRRLANVFAIGVVANLLSDVWLDASVAPKAASRLAPLALGLAALLLVWMSDQSSVQGPTGLVVRPKYAPYYLLVFAQSARRMLLGGLVWSAALRLNQASKIELPLLMAGAALATFLPAKAWGRWMDGEGERPLVWRQACWTLGGCAAVALLWPFPVVAGLAVAAMIWVHVGDIAAVGWLRRLVSATDLRPTLLAGGIARSAGAAGAILFLAYALDEKDPVTLTLAGLSLVAITLGALSFWTPKGP